MDCPYYGMVDIGALCRINILTERLKSLSKDFLSIVVRSSTWRLRNSWCA